MTEKKYLTVREVGEELRVSVNTVTRWIHEKKIPARRYGRQWRIPYEAVAGWLSNGDHVERKPKKLSGKEFSLEGMFTEGNPIPKEAIDKVIAEWERE